jgi:ABC-type dipeptide/oligopeptide/nickel transport system permease component
MNYYTKLILCIFLFFICFIILRFISTKEGLVNFGSYSFDKYYGNYRKDYGYNNNIYQYPVFFDKNYKNFSDNKINYNDVYDAVYKNIQTKN